MCIKSWHVYVPRLHKCNIHPHFSQPVQVYDRLKYTPAGYWAENRTGWYSHLRLYAFKDIEDIILIW